MGLQGFYPVFANGQVLTSAHLNDIVNYLEPQDRITRAALTGIGVVCGLDPLWDGGAVHLTGGVAVTSAGHLIVEPGVVLDRVRDYVLPTPVGARDDDVAPVPLNPFLTGDDGAQIAALELLPEDVQPGADSPPVRDVTAADLKGAVVMLFLESLQEDLKSCDVNDCSDRGAQMNLTLRRLLVSRNDAAAMLQREQGFTAAQVHRAVHGRIDLPLAGLEKINPAAAGLSSIDDLYARLLTTAVPALSQVAAGLDAGFAAYRPLLADLYPADRFPQGPVPAGYFLPVLAQISENPLLLQCLQDLAHHMVLAHNEFVVAAARFDAECRPDGRRFPLHVLLGAVQPVQTGFDGAPGTLADAVAFDPRQIRRGAAPEPAPRPFRHYFVPSEALDDGSAKRAEIRALYSRAVLLAQSFHTRGMLSAPLRITPSRDGTAVLGDRAIPAFLPFDDPDGDLLANWSAPKARDLTLSTVPGWQRTPDDLASHPLRLRREGDNFLRIEGHVGKPLGTVLADLYDQRQQLGLSFAVDPVFIGPENSQDDQAGQRALAAMAKLLLCRLRDLDVIFLMLMAGLIAFLIWLVQRLGRVDAAATLTMVAPVGSAAAAAAADDDDTSTGTSVGTSAGGLTAPGRFTMIRALSSGSDPTDLRAMALDASGAEILRPLTLVSERTLRLDPQETLALKQTADTTVKALRAGTLDTAVVIETLAAVDGVSPAQTTVAGFFAKVRDDSAGGDLFARVRAAAPDLTLADGSAAQADQVYPAVALMARSEELIASARAPSLAEFDADRFGTAVSGFADAYAAYAARAETDATKIGAETARTNTAIIAAAPNVTTTAARLGGGALGTELRKRVQSMFEDMTLAGYAKKHPGMEHKGGVPVGGTFVLLYGDRADLRRGVRTILAGIDGNMAKVFAALGGINAPAMDVAQIAQDLTAASTPRLSDPLEQFTVLGDFCHPEMCCDGDCGADIIRRQVPPPSRGPIDFTRPSGLRPAAWAQPGLAVDGLSLARDTSAVGLQRPSGGGLRAALGTYAPAVLRGQAVLPDDTTGEDRPAKWAVLRIVDADTGHEDRRDRLRDGAFNVELPPGRYEIQVLAEDRTSEVQTVTLLAGQTLKTGFRL
ncbi:MAG: hypothetical protein KDA50_12305 [Rhodobacteraceae bacterium]|nr:hypothetical protein [Paracoccaceae bacterium]